MALLAGLMEFIAAHPIILVLVFLLYVFCFILSVRMSGPKPGPNPFERDTRRAARPLETDSLARDKVLKQGFHVKRIPDKIDAIVIGSGIGGLTIANILARVGKRVLVLEQHDQAGGCCHTFVEKGFEFDVGIHYVGEMNHGSFLRTLMDQLTEGQLKWSPLDDIYDIVMLGEPGKQRSYPIHAGRKEFRQALLEKFPEEQAAIDKFMNILKKVKGGTIGAFLLKLKPRFLCRLLVKTGIIHLITPYYKFAHRSTKEVLDELTDNEDLKAVLCYSFGDFGTPPKNASFAMQCSIFNHFMYGGSYPTGGSSEIALHMIPIIEYSGGRVLVRAPVNKILTNSRGRVCGVSVQRSSGDIDIYAPLVISDAGVINTFTTLLPKEIAEKSDIYKLIGERIQSGYGCMSVFVGLKGSKEELGLKAQNIWAFTSNDLQKVTEDYLSLSAEEAMESDVPLIFASFPSAKDPTMEQRFPGKSTCTIITLAPWEWFSAWKEEQVNKRGQDYEAVKDAIGRRMWQQLLTLFPHLEDKVEYLEVGTPVTNNHYLGSPAGEIYGLDHDTRRLGSPEVAMELRPDTGIRGLMLTGQDVYTCGFSGALFGAVLTASAILRRNVAMDLGGLIKTINKNK